jgi:mannan endo-1,4-beta-mannosidase
VKKFLTALAIVVCAATAAPAQTTIPAINAPPTPTPSPDAASPQPDSREYVTRAETSLNLLGVQLRFGGMNLSWLGLRSDTGQPQDAHYPTEFELLDAMHTVTIMGAGYIRVTSLGASAGCALCVVPSLGQINQTALAHFDHVLKLAHDNGIKIVVPLSSGGACPATGALDPVFATHCTFARWRSRPDADFYRSAAVRADFAQYVSQLLNHLNPETAIMWKDDPTILAWENCDACGADTDPRTLSEWTEFVGQTIKAIDTHHLYENGAFAGRINTVNAAYLATPSVDIVGDSIAPHAGAAPDLFNDPLATVLKTGRVYLIDSYAWTPESWATEDDLQAFLTTLEKHRQAAAAFVSELGAHADKGGWLPPTRPSLPTLYFPGMATKQMDFATMTQRARAVRRQSYAMNDLRPAAFATVDQPDLLSVQHGKLAWRGAAGAVNYSVARSLDLTTTGSWQTLCEACVTDENPTWQDPNVPPGAVWYRITPFNANQHAGLPSEPRKNK